MTASERRRRRGLVSVLDPNVGLLIEPAATNLVPNNTNFSAWGTDRSAITIGLPFRGSTYGVLVSAASNDGGFSCLYRSNAFNPGAGTFVYSIRWKAGTPGTTSRILFRLAAGAVPVIDVTWQQSAGGAPINVTAVTGTGCGFFALPGNTGEYCIYGYSTAVTNAVHEPLFGITNNTGKSAYFALPQLESGRSPSTPIPNTGSSAVARNNETWSINTAPLFTIQNPNLILLERCRWLLREANDGKTYRLSGLNFAGLDVLSVNWNNTLNQFDQYFANQTVAPTPGVQPTIAQLLSEDFVAIAGDWFTPQVRTRGTQVSSGGHGNGSNTQSTLISSPLVLTLPRILFGLRIYDSSISRPSNAALDAANVTYPAGAIGAFDFLSILAGGTFTRSSIALNDQLQIVSNDTPRFTAGAF